jgi:hypothetical protein
MPPLPGIYYDFHNHNKIGYPFSGYRFVPQDKGRRVLIYDVRSRLVAIFLQDGSYKSEINKVTATSSFRFRLNEVDAKCDLGDAAPAFVTTVYKASIQVPGSKSSSAWAADYDGLWMLVILRRPEDSSSWRFHSELMNSVGFPSSFPSPPLASYHYVIFLLALILGFPIIPSNRNWLIDKYCQYRPFQEQYRGREEF